jgi:hypothetical protein
LLGTIAASLSSSHAAALAKPLRIPVADAERLGQTAVPVAILFAGFGAFGLLARCRRSASLCFLCLALFPPLFINAGFGAFEVVLDAKSDRRIAAQLSGAPPETEFVCLECFPTGLPFYLGRTVTLISRDGGELTSNYIIHCLKENPRWPEQIVPLADVDQWLASRKTPVYLLSRERDRSRLETIAAARNAKIQPISPGYLGLQLPVPGNP